jgi:hypothetical protein
MAVLFYISINNIRSSSCSTTLQYLILSILAVLIGAKWSLIIVLICISLMTNDPFSHVLTSSSCIFFCEVSIQICCSLLIRLFVFLLLSNRNNLCILNTSPFVEICFDNIFFLSVICLFVFLCLTFDNWGF